MIFSLEGIKKAQNMYTGPDFPKLVEEYKKMGIITNTYNIERGEVTYINNLGACIIDTGIKVEFQIPDTPTYEKALLGLKRNQTGKSDFITFCNEVAQTGIYKWVVNLENMTCDYYDKNEIIVISEVIPSV